MRTSLVLTVIGTDRPGIVEQISAQVSAADANWEESRMAHLADKFAGLLRISVDADRADRLAAGLRNLATDGLTIVVERGPGADDRRFHTLSLELVGSDRPGIVRDISRVLAQHGVNIEELETTVTPAAMSGEPLFRARARLRLPESTDAATVRAALEAMATDLMVDLVFGEAERQPEAS